MKLTTTAFVFAEHWPSASFVARSLGCFALHTYVKQTTPDLRESLKHGGLEDPVLSISEIQCILATGELNAGYMVQKLLLTFCYCGLVNSGIWI